MHDVISKLEQDPKYDNLDSFLLEHTKSAIEYAFIMYKTYKNNPNYSNIYSNDGYNSLTKRLRQLRSSYYAGKPEVSDFEYDMLEKSLEIYEYYNPEVISKDSISQTVGASNDDIQSNTI